MNIIIIISYLTYGLIGAFRELFIDLGQIGAHRARTKIAGMFVFNVTLLPLVRLAICIYLILRGMIRGLQKAISYALCTSEDMKSSTFRRKIFD
jgi:hypothetical protein